MPSAGLLVRDFRHALRRLTRDWPFAAAAVLILAVGIGSNTAIFTVINAALLRPQSFPQSERLVNIYQNTGEQRVPTGVSFAAFRDIAQQATVFDSTSAILSSGESVYQTPDGGVHPGIIEFTTSRFLRTLDLRPARGRWFNEQEDGTAAGPVAVIGYRTWTDEFHSDPDILGKTVRFGRANATIVGIAPRELRNSQSPAVFTNFWLSISSLAPVNGAAADLLERRENPIFLAKARLRDGVSLSQAQAAMDVLATRLKADHADTDPGKGITVLRSRDVRFGPQLDRILAPAALALLAIVGLSLAIACSNLATMLLVRGSARAKEIAVRLALGATRWQLVRSLLSESVILATLGAGGGWAIASAAFRLLLANFPIDVSLDYRVLLYVTVLALITGVGSGLAPALASTKTGLASGLRDQTGASNSTRGWLTLKNVLIVGQVVASFLLLIVTGFGVRFVAAAAQQDPGFQVAGVAMLQTDTRFTGSDRAREQVLMQEFVRRVEAIPGVESVFATNGFPPGDFSDARIQLDGTQPLSGDQGITTLVGWATAGTFETLRVPVLFGRTFTTDDRPDTSRVAIVNETMARAIFGGTNAVGKHFRYAESRQASFTGTAEVVGVVGDTRETDNIGFVQPLFYLSSVQAGNVPSMVMARTSLDPSQLAQRMREELRSLNPSLPVVIASSMQSFRDEGLAPWNNGIAMLGGLAVMGLGLASLGLYAVVAFAVTRRSQEIGIRMALGARGLQVIWLMMSDVLILTAVGIALGIGISVGVLAVLSVNTPAATGGLPAPVTDPWTFAAIAAVMAGAGLLAAYFPARRATQGDPLTALRVG
jgi:putative ABC transport system permease protein